MRTGDKRSYVLAVGMLALLEQKRKSEALGLFREYGKAIFGESAPPLVFRLLAGLAAK